MKPSQRWAMRYAAIELVPMTASGHAQRFKPWTSTTWWNAARSQKHHPPLTSTQAGVQIRFTLGQRPLESRTSPAPRAAAPARRYRRTGAPSASQRPAIRPRIAVASVGMKERVR